MLRLTLIIKRARSRSHLALHLAQINGVNRESHAGWGGVLGCVDHAGRGVFVFEEERTAEDELATEAAAIAPAVLIRFPPIENPVGQYRSQYPAPRRAVRMLGVEKAQHFANRDTGLDPVNLR